ncbi:MAG: hypothetical protein U1E76_15195 [Planctomycetota bacterium]
MVRIEDLCASLTHHENGLLEVVGPMEENLLAIRFACDDWLGSGVRRRFLLSCLGTVERQLDAGSSEEIRWVDQHPVLWTFNSPHGYLHLGSRPADAFAAVGRLYEAHEQLFQGWKALREFLNPGFTSNLHELLEGGRGMLAQGPCPVLERYRDALQPLMETYLNDAPHDRRYDAQHPKRALIFDDCYVVCDSVDVKELLDAGSGAVQP